MSFWKLLFTSARRDYQADRFTDSVAKGMFQRRSGSSQQDWSWKDSRLAFRLMRLMGHPSWKQMDFVPGPSSTITWGWSDTAASWPSASAAASNFVSGSSDLERTKVPMAAIASSSLFEPCLDLYHWKGQKLELELLIIAVAVLAIVTLPVPEPGRTKRYQVMQGLYSFVGRQ